MRVRFGLLGDLVAEIDGKPVDLGHARQRCVFAVLLLDANRVVATDRLIGRVWGNDAPGGVRTTLYGYLYRLRRLLPDGCGVAIVRRAGGYVLTVDPAVVDVHLFAMLVDGARAARDEPTALDLFDQASALWRGEAFMDLTTPWLDARRSSLERDRLAAELDRADLALKLGRHAESAAALAALADSYPTDERLASQLMRALHGSGRRAEALEHYRHVRDRLVEQAGTEPSAALQRIQHEILLEDHSSPGGSAMPAAVTAWRQLPMDIDEFTGRERELHRLDEWVRPADRVAPSPTIVIVTGMAGVGKTRLAVHAAHRLTAGGRFDEVQLWSDLHGFDEGASPAEPAAVLESFLRLLHVPGDLIPEDLESRAALYRDRLVDKRTLILLDNVASEEQIRPLLPGTSETLVLITTRRNLSDVDGARILPLDVLTGPESVKIMARIADDGRISAASDTAAKVAELCGHLPIAIVLAARRLRARPMWTVADLVGRLTLADQRIDTLSSRTRLLRNVFDLSYRGLSPSLRRMFRLLGMHVGDDFTAMSAAALFGCDPYEAEHALEDLLDEHLVQQTVAGRYRFHDLMREYARDRAMSEDTTSTREAAVHRLLIWLLHAAEAARGPLDPTRVRIIDLPTLPGGSTLPISTGYDEAARWFEEEHSTLMAAVRGAHQHGLADVAWQLAWVLLSFHYPRSLWNDWITSYRIGLTAAQESKRRRGEGIMWRGLGVAYSDMRQYDAARACHIRAQEILEEVGDTHGQAWNLNNLGVVHVDLDEFTDAAHCFRRALSMFRVTDDRQGEGFALNNLGDACLRLGRHDEALRHLEQALAVQHETRDQGGVQFTLSTLGDLHHASGRHQEAVNYYRRALAVSRALGHPRTVARTLAKLARSHVAVGQPETALAHWREAHDIMVSIGDPQATEIPYQIKGPR